MRQLSVEKQGNRLGYMHRKTVDGLHMHMWFGAVPGIAATCHHLARGNFFPRLDGDAVPLQVA